MEDSIMRFLSLRDYFRKPTGRAGQHPHYLEIVVARTGHPAHTFRINLDTLKKAGTALGTLGLVWFVGTFYVAYSHIANMEAIASADAQAEKIALLESSNEKLAEEKQNMGQHLFNLRERVEQLALRMHGLVNRTGSEFPVEQAGKPQGGMAIPLDAANASQIMSSEFALLDDRLNSLLPELETTMAREVSRPVGTPIAGLQDISSRYGLRANPFGRGHEFHNGIDFVVDRGTPIQATAPGRVEAAGYDGPNGNRVAIDHGFGYRSVYAHLSRLSVKSGEQVQRGQTIGFSGNTGRSSGPHLHYTLYYRGQTVDPARYVRTN
jgi:murein DD-endopeptidase MepM/ murein hydrolase activator NlpD